LCCDGYPTTILLYHYSLLSVPSLLLLSKCLIEKKKVAYHRQSRRVAL